MICALAKHTFRQPPPGITLIVILSFQSTGFGYFSSPTQSVVAAYQEVEFGVAQTVRSHQGDCEVREGLRGLALERGNRRCGAEYAAAAQFKALPQLKE